MIVRRLSTNLPVGAGAWVVAYGQLCRVVDAWSGLRSMGQVPAFWTRVISQPPSAGSPVGAISLRKHSRALAAALVVVTVHLGPQHFAAGQHARAAPIAETARPRFQARERRHAREAAHRHLTVDQLGQHHRLGSGDPSGAECAV